MIANGQLVLRICCWHEILLIQYPNDGAGGSFDLATQVIMIDTQEIIVEQQNNILPHKDFQLYTIVVLELHKFKGKIINFEGQKSHDIHVFGILNMFCESYLTRN